MNWKWHTCVQVMLIFDLEQPLIPLNSSHVVDTTRYWWHRLNQNVVFIKKLVPRNENYDNKKKK